MGVKVREAGGKLMGGRGEGEGEGGGSTRDDLWDPAAAERREGETSGVVQAKGSG